MLNLSQESQDVLTVLPWVEEWVNLNRSYSGYAGHWDAIKATEREQTKIKAELDSWDDSRYYSAFEAARTIVESLYGE